MKKKERKTIYWEVPVMGIILLIAHIAVYISFFMYLTGGMEF